MTTVTTSCMRCGEIASVETSDWQADYWRNRGEQFPWMCAKCASERDAEREREEEEQAAEERRNSIDGRLDDAGVPLDYQTKEPPVPKVADFLKRHLAENILLSAPSGAGKSTSAGYLARILIEQGKKVRYFTLASILDQWREARCSDYPISVKAFLSYIEWNDVVIIDEAADKTVPTDSAKECMFRLLEDVSNRTCNAHLWLLGNFYRGAIEDVFGNGEAARRRLNEKFYCAMITKDGQLKHIQL